MAVPLSFLLWRSYAPDAATENILEPDFSGASLLTPSPLVFEKQSISPAVGYPPIYTNVKFVDLDQDGLVDVLACDANTNGVVHYRQEADGSYSERVLAAELGTPPAHATAVDIDADGDLDVLVAGLGDLRPNDGVIGSVLCLEQREGVFHRREILSGVRRVSDVQPGDLDDDGDIDVVVSVFGYAHGEVLWLENDGTAQEFTAHRLLATPGPIHVPLADFDGDGDLDIATVSSQDEEEVWGFENDGDGNFTARRLFFTPNFDIGSAGLVTTDLDGDGDADLLLPVGDNLEQRYSYPQPYHGCLWLENLGDWTFETRRIATFGGTYAAAAGDIDGDGDQDVALASWHNDWSEPRATSLAWLENDGEQNFTAWEVAHEPSHLITVGCADANADGRDDIVVGGLHLQPPYDRLGGVTLFSSTSEIVQ